MTPPPFDDWAVTCPRPWCRQPPRSPCRTKDGGPAETHAPRRQMSLELAALADPALDPWFSAEHGHPDWRRAIVTGIAGRAAAREDAVMTAADFEVPLAAVEAVAAWATRWPGAW